MIIHKTMSSGQTRKLGEEFANELKGGEIVCLDGELGSGKTTFAQGFLAGLGARGPFTSPTFVIMKEYLPGRKHGGSKIKKIYHLDVYRAGPKDILNLGWREIIDQPGSVILIEWARKIEEIIPKKAIWISFSWSGKDKRKIMIKYT